MICTYDAAGNLLTKLTAELKKSISDKAPVTYTYDYERLSEVLYPKNLFNRVTYTYGKPGEKYNRAGRLVLVEDASGGEAYYYGNQGEVVKTVRSVMVSTADVRTYVYGTTYDSWNRVRTMTYPDGEVVTYGYNAAGQVESIRSERQGKEEAIVEEVGYDKEGHTVYTRLGNGTETTYTYDRQRERLQEMNLTAAGAAVMTNKYRYDAVDNILGITNAIDPAKAGGKSRLGGAFSHTYAYDELNRLITASGKAKSASYEMAMTFGRMSEPLTKVQKVDSTRTAQSYDFTYRYEDDSHPTAPTQVGHDHYTYDANGNPILVENDSLNTERRMYWDEDNRLMVLSDNGKTSRYTYNAAGERIVKSHGDLEGVYINGAPQGISFHETEDYTIYPAPIITVTKNRFTKHYFIGSKRIASKIGTGRFSNVYGIGGNNITAGQKDYAARMMQIEKQREEYYKQLGTPPGVPTMKGATADPDNTGIGYNSIITELGDHSVPEGWIQHPKFNGKGDVPGPPIQWSEPESPDNAQPGYGYAPVDTTNTEEIFFYHSDHLGSTSYITDAKANITQFDAYLPYGELLVDEHSSSEDMPYKFNGKELDQETGLYYYGARYMNPVTSLWMSTDPLEEFYPNITSYTYCHNNPIILIDPSGMSDKEAQKRANTLIDQFEKSKTTSVFPHISKSEFINDLRSIVKKPSSIDQKEDGTCGAAVLCKYLADEQPELFVKTAISLYTKGKATNRSMTLSVTDDMKKEGANCLSAVNTIMQGALTNANNWFLSYNPNSDGSGIRSFTYPGFISRFLKQFVGATFRVKPSPTTRGLGNINFQDYFVIGLITQDFSSSPMPNHYIQITKVNNDKIHFWSWGSSYVYTTKNNYFNGIKQAFLIQR